MVSDTPASTINPLEKCLESNCRNLIKNQLFIGYYKERCYVEAVNGYRDLIVVNRNEKKFLGILDVIQKQLVEFYRNSEKWIGVNTGDNCLAVGSPDTYIWAELDDIAFDHYWFSVKTIQFRNDEVVFKLKAIRSVESEPNVSKPDKESTPTENITMEDFLHVIRGWGLATKQTIYNFMSNDINKEKLQAVFNFSILFLISIFTASVEAIKFIGMFSIQLMAELRKFLAVATPIIFRLIDFCGKVVGGIFILLAMIWRDLIGSRCRPRQEYRVVAYNKRPYYKR